MNSIRMISWNVNGLRAVWKKGFRAWLLREQPDMLCLQETKIQENQILPFVKEIPGYVSYFASATKKGYSGVALYTRHIPQTITRGFGIEEYDCEGRVLMADYVAFVLFSVYFPNGKISQERLRYKMAFYDAFLDHVVSLRKHNRKLIICGDVNTAHTAIDLARPRENKKVSGFLPEEREWIDRFVSHGFIDTFRLFNRDGGNYTWWDLKSRARDRNVGWRIDYFFVSDNLKKHVRRAYIMSDVFGSDHCPVGIELSV